MTGTGTKRGAATVEGRLVLADRVLPGVIRIQDGLIAAIEPDERAADGPFIAPGYIDVHVHGWGGHSEMGGRASLDGMARALLRRGVTSFLPTAWSAPIERLAAFADAARGFVGDAPQDGADPLGFNLEGPFLATARKGAHDPTHLRNPADVATADIEQLLEGLSLITIAPDLAGAMDLIALAVARGARVSLGHSAATVDQAWAGYRAGATSTTHLFNAMTGVHHHHPGLAVAALANDAAYVELIADGHHVDASLHPIISRTKPRDRLLLVSDGVSIAGSQAGRVQVDGLDLEIEADGRIVLAGTRTLAGGGTPLGAGVQNMVRWGSSLPDAVSAASTNPAAMLGRSDRGRIDVGLRADLVELDDALAVRRVMRAGDWFEAS